MGEKGRKRGMKKRERRRRLGGNERNEGGRKEGKRKVKEVKRMGEERKSKGTMCRREGRKQAGSNILHCSFHCIKHGSQ